MGVTSDDDVVVAGSFVGTMDFGTTTLTSADWDGFVVSLDGVDGQVKWVRLLAGPGDDFVRGLAVDSDDGLNLAGSFTGKLVLDPSDSDAVLDAGAADDKDMFVAKLDVNGNHVWSRSFGGELDQSAFAIDTGTQGQLAIAGILYGDLELEPGNPLGCTGTGGEVCGPSQTYGDLFAAVLLP